MKIKLDIENLSFEAIEEIAKSYHCPFKKPEMITCMQPEWEGMQDFIKVDGNKEDSILFNKYCEEMDIYKYYIKEWVKFYFGSLSEDELSDKLQFNWGKGNKMEVCF